MEKKEKKLVERVLGKELLKNAETYGNAMRLSVAAKGANQKVCETIGRIAEIAFVKGAENFRENLWHELKKKYPAFGTFMLCKGTPENGNHLFIAKLEKDGKGGMRFVGEDGKKTEQVTHWMVIPNVEEV